MKRLTESEWEQLCDGCGTCCNAANGVACPSLDQPTGRCTVYENRFEVERCLKITPANTMWMHDQGILPDTCAYVRHMRGQPLAPIPENTLIPFAVAHPRIQRLVINKRDQHFANIRRTTT